MKTAQIYNIARWSTAALVIPILGQVFVDGWNWGPGDFVFAWVFFNILGLSYSFVTGKIQRPQLRFAAGTVVVLLFVFIWVMLATG